MKFKIRDWGGKRRGAGRKNRSHTVNHMKRKKIDPRKPLHLNIKVKQGLPNLRHSKLLKEFKKSAQFAKSKGLRLLHYSIETNHIHLIVEATGNKDLANGLRSCLGRYAKAIRRFTFERGYGKKSGPVFAGRYHATPIQSPRQMRNTIRYVLTNISKHTGLIVHLDRFSSAYTFDQWRELLKGELNPMIKSQLENRGPPELASELSPPKTWLATAGWKKVAN